MVGRMKLTDLNLIEIFQQNEFENLVTNFREKHFAKKEILFMEGTGQNLVYIVKKGKVKIYLTYEEKEFTLTILEKGDIYATHTRGFAQALEDCSILTIEASEFQRLLKEVPSLSMVMVKVLGDCLRNSIDIIEGLAFKQAESRIAEFLYKLTIRRGKETNSGVVLKLSLTTEEIAALIGSTRQTVSSLINGLEKEGIIERIEKKNILIKKVEKLEEMAKGMN
ncbi:MAG: Crp/Fnr family transcriptional regulator [Bacillota bacterium]|nr:Crp/Fnr family transcriptional regulator [Bacillota bacterium]